MSESYGRELLIIFTRNPVLGQCKTRLARTVGDQAALDIYRFLLRHTEQITRPLPVDKWVCYSDKPIPDDLWNELYFEKKVQMGNTLGERMKGAFSEGFAAGYDRICIIGSDMYDLNTQDIHAAFRILESCGAVIGPAQDGGYYLLGLKNQVPGIFENKEWGSDTVFTETIAHFNKMTYGILPVKNDVDYYEDIKDVEAFRPFLTNIGL